MAIIIPAILPSSREDLEQKLAQASLVATAVQIDAVDGVFVSPASWPYQNKSTGGPVAAIPSPLPHLDTLQIEVDLMVTAVEGIALEWIASGVTRVLVHLESTTELGHFITAFNERYGHEKGFASELLSFGVAIHAETNTELIEPYLDNIDYVQFMGITRIGVQGQPFSDGVLNKIKRFRAKHPTVPVQVDGGVSLLTAPALLDAGVSRLVVGSALWRAPNFNEAYEKFVELTLSHGLYEH